jgi:hypothetical protein
MHHVQPDVAVRGMPKPVGNGAEHGELKRLVQLTACTSVSTTALNTEHLTAGLIEFSDAETG